MRLAPTALLLGTLAPALALAQGQLTPPSGAFSYGVPTATMKTLDQVEPRIPLTQPTGSTAGLTIWAPGSYYLTGNVTVTSGHGISINADNVTLDLNGFTIRSSASPAADNAILINGAGALSSIAYSAITIRNGHISGTGTVDSASGVFSGAGFNCGIYYYSTLRSCLISDLTINGVASDGIYLNASSTIDRCTVTDCGSDGIRGGTISNCSATLCGQTAIEGTTIFNSQGTSVSTTAIAATTATNCIGTSTKGIGLYATQNATGCSGTTVSGPKGLTTAFCGTAENCRGTVTGDGATGIGLAAETATNCFGESSSGIGLSASTATNCSARSISGSPSMAIAGTATGCRGNSGKPGGNAIEAAIAVACTTYSGAITGNKQLGTP